jgi:hypothetical protein
LFTLPNVPEVVLPNTGPWGLLTGDEILENLVSMNESFLRQNKGVHQADNLMLAPDAYSAAVTKQLTAGVAPTSPLVYYKQLYPEVTVQRIYELQNAYAGPPLADMCMLYERRIENIAHLFVMVPTFLPPEVRNLEFVINGIARSGGVHLYRPLALINAITS